MSKVRSGRGIRVPTVKVPMSKVAPVAPLKPLKPEKTAPETALATGMVKGLGVK